MTMPLCDPPPVRAQHLTVKMYSRQMQVDLGEYFAMLLIEPAEIQRSGRTQSFSESVAPHGENDLGGLPARQLGGQDPLVKHCFTSANPYSDNAPLAKHFWVGGDLQFNSPSLRVPVQGFSIGFLGLESQLLQRKANGNNGERVMSANQPDRFLELSIELQLARGVSLQKSAEVVQCFGEFLARSHSVQKPGFCNRGRICRHCMHLDQFDPSHVDLEDFAIRVLNVLVVTGRLCEYAAWWKGLRQAQAASCGIMGEL